MILDRLAYIINPFPRKWKPRDRKGMPIFDYWQRKRDREFTAKIKMERFVKGENPNKAFRVKTESKVSMSGRTS